MNNLEVNIRPLVTIAVITYNSADYVVETLESIKRQTYPNIELIVSDDGSSDDTVSRCKTWLSNNRDRFVSTQVIQGKNGGVAVNTNRALYAAKGEWFKDLSGDDILPDDAVEKHIAFVSEKPQVDYFFGKEIFFYGDFSEANFEPQKMLFRHVFFGDKVSAKRQYRMLTRQFFGAPAATMGRVATLKEIGGYNEAIPMTEDGPLYLALTKAGHKLYYFDDYTVYRRRHSDSYGLIGDGHIVDNDAILSVAEVRNYECYSFWDLQAENSTWFWRLMHKYSNFLWRKIIENGNNKHSFKCRFYNFLRRYINPFKYNMIIWCFKEFVCKLFHNP